MPSDATNNPICFDFEKVYDDCFIESKFIGAYNLYLMFFTLGLKESLPKIVIISYLSFIFYKNHDFVLLKLLVLLLSNQIKFLCMEHDQLSNVIESLKTLSKNTYSFKFYHVHFKDFFIVFILFLKTKKELSL